MPHEAESGEHRQRRARHQQRIGIVYRRVCLRHTIFRHALAEVDDVGFEHATAFGAIDDRERRRIIDHGVGIGSDGDATDGLGALDEIGIGGFEQFGQRSAGHGVAAVKANHLGVGAVQVDDVAAARLRMQQIDVLGDDAETTPERSSAASAR